MTKPVILTGLRANNDLHIGNYFGALLPIIDMARAKSNEYQINLFIPDLHSFTTPIDHSQLQAQIMHNLKLFVAAGLPLDNPDIHIYRQSYVPAHSELTWILDCFTGFGEMSRMIQFKEKMSVLMSSYYKNANDAAELRRVSDGFQGTEIDKMNEEANELTRLNEKMINRVSVGLFNYPVLMATDMLLYDAIYVPVGDDQTQHLEFTRDIATRMNNTFGDLFTMPKPVKEQHAFFGKDQGLRIKDLADPTKKMSKSDETGKGVIFLGDTPEAAAKKVMSATTDSFGEIRYDKQERLGIANLLEILTLLQAKTLDEVRGEWEGKQRYGELKQAVAEAVQHFLVDFQTKLAAVDEQAITTKLAVSEAAMNDKANATLLKVQQAVGLRA